MSIVRPTVCTAPNSGVAIKERPSVLFLGVQESLFIAAIATNWLDGEDDPADEVARRRVDQAHFDEP
jgi:hypothetical protein